MDYGNRRRIRRIANSPVAVFFALIIFAVSARAVWNMHQKAKLADARLMQAQSELAKLEDRRNDLSGKVEYLASERGKEAAMRLKYRAVRDGESVAVIVDESKTRQVAAAGVASTSSTSAREAVDSESQKLGFWKRMLRLVGIGR